MDKPINKKIIRKRKVKIIYLLLSITLQVITSSANATYINDRFDGEKQQIYDYSCGISAVAYIFNRYYNIEKSEAELISLTEIKPEYSFLDLTSLAEKFSIETSGVKLSTAQLKKIKSPTILFINRLGKKHFVLYNGMDDGWVQLYDPAWGYLNYTLAQFESYWLHDVNRGRALIFSKRIQTNLDENKILYKKLHAITTQ
ncbi:C39 family peptidase [Serratia proteamaculans]|uniref:C39 family peptidase n=1 Tax=Serratia proteamaculans TaxID=28151 RepID=UPI0039AFEBEF